MNNNGIIYECKKINTSNFATLIKMMMNKLKGEQNKIQQKI